jgi:hypothetical protein
MDISLPGQHRGSLSLLSGQEVQGPPVLDPEMCFLGMGYAGGKIAAEIEFILKIFNFISNIRTLSPTSRVFSPLDSNCHQCVSLVSVVTMKLLSFSFLPLSLSLLSSVLALGQNATVTLTSGSGLLQLAGKGINGQILLSANDWWGVIRAAEDLAGDFGKVTGTNLTLGNFVSGQSSTANVTKRDGQWKWDGKGPKDGPHHGEHGSGSGTTVLYTYNPPTNDINVSLKLDSKITFESNNEKYTVDPAQNFTGPTLLTNSKSKTVIIAGTIGKSDVINALVASGKLDVKSIQDRWESFISQVITSPLPGVDKALVIAGSDLRGTIYGLYDISEQIGVSPWWWFADVPVRKASGVWALATKKVQGPPSVKYRGIFINDEQPGLTNWIKYVSSPSIPLA